MFLNKKMANNQNGNSGLRNRKSANKSNGNYELQQQGNMYNYNHQMMGWMPQYPPQQQPQNYGMGGMGGWMPQYPPQQQNYGMAMGGWMPQYPPPQQQQLYQQPPQQNYGMGPGAWMSAPGMQPPMMMLPPPAPAARPAFNNRGFAPSHNGDIQDIVQIKELEDTESSDNEPINPTASNNIAGGAAAAAATMESDDDDPDVVHVPAPKIKHQAKEAKEAKQSKQSKQKAPVAKQDKNSKEYRKQNQNQDNQLANLFDNALDEIQVAENPQEDYYAEFGQESNNSNVIVGLEPVDKKQAHFDCIRYPNELYYATMINDEVNKLSAKDISLEALETGKIVFEHNTQLAASGQPIIGKAFIYARSSRSNDISIETQRKACLKYAKEHNLALLPFGYQSDNNVSARNMGNLKHELGFWKDVIPDNSHIIIYSVDRLARHLTKGMEFLEEMASRGIHIHFTTHELVFHSGISAAGRAMVQQELQSAEKFSNIASEKVRTTMARLRQEGHVFGRAPYGYKHTLVGNIRKRVLDNQEQQNIQKIRDQLEYMQNNWKNNPDTAVLRCNWMNMLSVLARWCNRVGLKYRNNKNYTKSQLRRITGMQYDNN